jgi:2-aminoadipate transaminase
MSGERLAVGLSSSCLSTQVRARLTLGSPSDSAVTRLLYLGSATRGSFFGEGRLRPRPVWAVITKSGEVRLQIPLDRASGVPLSLQLKRHLERAIAAGELPPEAKLPASRELARALRLNRNTVTTAYEMLVAEGWARAHVGQGTFVLRRDGGPGTVTGPPDPAGQRGALEAGSPPIDWEGALSRAARRVAAEGRRRAGFDVGTASDPGVISFGGASPDPTLFPTEAFRVALNRVIRREGKSLLQYHPVAGYPPLRRFVAAWLARQGIETHEDQVLVVNGSQQGLDLIARVLLDPGDPVVLEQPTYPGAIQTFGAGQCQILPVPVGAAGLRVDALDSALERHRPKLIYCQPTGHNPTGVSLDPGGRRALLDLAARHRVPIVEDGFGGPGDAPLPLIALDRHELVLHLGTFSKILFPGLRLGWMVVPRPLVEPVLAVKQLADLHTGALLQAAVFHFCQGGRLERHAETVRAEYARRRAVLLDTLARHLPRDSAWTRPDGSAFSLLVTLPEGLDAGELAPLALARGVSYTPGAFFFVAGQGARTLRLSFASLPAARIEAGVRRLAAVIRHARRRARRPATTAASGLPVV